MTENEKKRFVVDLWSLEDFEIIKREIIAQTDRGAAVLAASLLDEHLKWAIDRLFVEMSNKDAKSIFDGTGPLSTFKGRTDICFALGVIDQACRRDLGIIGRIRNRFAHRVEVITFNEPTISSLCEQLLLPVGHLHLLRPDQMNRSKFLFSCWLLRTILLGNAERRPRPITPTTEKLIEAWAEAADATPPFERSF
jgi:DNA-binding MltR family transcriptional regulator